MKKHCLFAAMLCAIVASTSLCASAQQSFYPTFNSPTSAPIYAQSPEMAALEARIAQLESGLAKKSDKQDTKKAFSTPKLYGFVNIDTTNFMSDPGYGIANSAGFREIRIGIKGEGYDFLDYKVELSYGAQRNGSFKTEDSGKLNIADVVLGIKKVPCIDYLRVGHFKTENGMAFVTAVNNTITMEQSEPSNPFAEGRKLGAGATMLSDDKRIRLFVGLFGGQSINSDRMIYDDNQGSVFNMRLSGTPIYTKNSRCLLHVGGHWMYVNNPVNAKIGTSPVGYNGSPQFVSSGNIDVDGYHRLGLEALWQYGAFALHSEAYVALYGDSTVDNIKEDRQATGMFVQARYCFTGENREYDSLAGIVGGMKPYRNFTLTDCGASGLGAWEGFLHWGYVNLDDFARPAAGNSYAGSMHDITLGLNWFWNPNVRWTMQYTHAMPTFKTTAATWDETSDILAASFRFNF